MTDLTIVEKKEDKVKEIPLKKRVEALTPGEDFNIFQQMLQEIQATDIAQTVDSEAVIPLTKQLEKLKNEIFANYREEPNTRQLLLDYFPTYKTIYSWTVREEWKNAVIKRVKRSFNFSEKRRTKVFDAIYQKAVLKGDMKAAELFCKLSGDISTSNNFGKKDEKDDSNMSLFNKIMSGKK